MKTAHLTRLLAISLATAASGLIAAPAFASSPIAVDDSYYFEVGSTTLVAAGIGLLANDINDGSDIRVKVLSGTLPSGFTFASDGGFTISAANSPETSTFTYCITYADTQDICASSNTATVTIRVVAEPVAGDDSYSTPYNTGLEVAAPGVLANDTNVPQGARVGWVSQPTGFAGGSDGGFTFHPGLTGGTKTANYCIVDVHGLCMSNTATVTITAGATPAAVDDSYTTTVNTALTVAAPGVMANDTNVPADATVSWQTTPPAGFTLAPDGGISYTPAAGFVGQVSVPYCILTKSIPPSCASNNATITITVKAPSAVDDSYTTPAGIELSVAAPGVLANDTSLPAGAIVSWQTDPAPPAGLTLAADGGFTYLPPAGFTGLTVVTYCITLDPAAPCLGNNGVVTITVTASGGGGGGGGGLPVTGPGVTLLVAFGVMLLLAGATVVYMLRPRRIAG